MFLDLNDFNIGSGTALDPDSHRHSLTPSQTHIYTLSLPTRDVCFAASLSCKIDLLALHPSEEDHLDHYLYKLTPQTVVAFSWSHYHWYPTDEYLHLTPVCITKLSTSCKTNHLCIVYIIPGKNWHLMVLNFKLISYRPWAELFVRGRQQRCGYGHFRELTWYLKWCPSYYHNVLRIS